MSAKVLLHLSQGARASLARGQKSVCGGARVPSPVSPTASTDGVIQVSGFQQRKHTLAYAQKRHDSVALRTLCVHALYI